MFKKIMAALMCITMAAAFAGCGSDKDSSSESESSATEAATEAPTEAPAEAETEAEASAPEEEAAAIEDEAEDELYTADTAEVTEAILDGTWQSGYIADAQGNIMTITDYSEALGVDPSTFDLQMEFAEDGTAKLNSTTDGEETGTYTVDGALITLTDDTDGSEMVVIYDTESEMLFVDLLGTGEFLIGFTIE